MKVTGQRYDIKTGKYETFEYDDPNVISEAEGIERDKQQAIIDHNDAIKVQLAANDAKIVRAAVESLADLASKGVAVLDADRLQAHLSAQAALRAQFK